MADYVVHDFADIGEALKKLEQEREEARNRVVNEPAKDPYEAQEPTKPWPYGAWGATPTPSVDDVYVCYQPSQEEFASAMHSWDKEQNAEGDRFREWQKSYAQYLVFHKKLEGN